MPVAVDALVVTLPVAEVCGGAFAADSTSRDPRDGQSVVGAGDNGGVAAVVGGALQRGLAQ